MKKLWLKNGRLILDAQRRVTECDHCPCCTNGCLLCTTSGECNPTAVKLTISNSSISLKNGDPINIDGVYTCTLSSHPTGDDRGCYGHVECRFGSPRYTLADGNIIYFSVYLIRRNPYLALHQADAGGQRVRAPWLLMYTSVFVVGQEPDWETRGVPWAARAKWNWMEHWETGEVLAGIRPSDFDITIDKVDTDGDDLTIRRLCEFEGWDTEPAFSMTNVDDIYPGNSAKVAFEFNCDAPGVNTCWGDDDPDKPTPFPPGSDDDGGEPSTDDMDGETESNDPDGGGDDPGHARQL